MGLDTVAILYKIEHRFGIRFSDDITSKMLTVADTHDEVIRLLTQTRPIATTSQLRQEVWDSITQIIAERMGIDPSEIKPESTWVGDITDYG